MREKIRIAAGQGFWGDLLDAPVRQVEGGPIDYLMLDYLAEVTMSIMQKQKARDPNAGYARDFIPLMKRMAMTKYMIMKSTATVRMRMLIRVTMTRGWEDNGHRTW